MCHAPIKKYLFILLHFYCNLQDTTRQNLNGHSLTRSIAVVRSSNSGYPLIFISLIQCTLWNLRSRKPNSGQSPIVSLYVVTIYCYSYWSPLVFSFLYRPAMWVFCGTVFFLSIGTFNCSACSTKSQGFNTYCSVLLSVRRRPFYKLEHRGQGVCCEPERRDARQPLKQD